MGTGTGTSVLATFNLSDRILIQLIPNTPDGHNHHAKKNAKKDGIEDIGLHMPYDVPYRIIKLTKFRMGNILFGVYATPWKTVE